MANTQSSRANAWSHIVPKQRPTSFERAKARSHSTPKRRPSVDGKNAAGGMRKTRSTKLDRTYVSLLLESECGSSSTQYCSSRKAKIGIKSILFHWITCY
ncbi:calmodulin-binding protein 60 C-like [Iris pallida]|uniref:Calmodulin-binding protein 60 C-like n=1 Tax=Iris pallida TaxID=29817 RepID=A0AAX6EE14_IRIPA|nr:calmodulin-binding protein 60 C-like [Iris pallida]